MRENRNFNNRYGCLGQQNRNRGEGFRGNGNGQGCRGFGRNRGNCLWGKDGFSSNETTENFFGSFENREQEEIFLKSLKSKVDDRLNEIAKV